MMMHENVAAEQIFFTNMEMKHFIEIREGASIILAEKGLSIIGTYYCTQEIII